MMAASGQNPLMTAVQQGSQLAGIMPNEVQSHLHPLALRTDVPPDGFRIRLLDEIRHAHGQISCCKIIHHRICLVLRIQRQECGGVWSVIEHHGIELTPKIVLHHGRVLPSRIAIRLARLRHKIADIHTPCLARSNRLTHARRQ